MVTPTSTRTKARTLFLLAVWLLAVWLLAVALVSTPGCQRDGASQRVRAPLNKGICAASALVSPALLRKGTPEGQTLFARERGAAGEPKRPRHLAGELERPPDGTGEPESPRRSAGRSRAPDRDARGYTPPPRLVVRFFAAGHGDAALLRTPAGHVVLVDAGRGNRLLMGDNLAARRLLPHLRELGIRRLDAFIITHPHPDHVGDAPRLATRLDIARYYLNPGGMKKLAGILEGVIPQAQMESLHRGRRLAFGRLRLQVLHPPKGAVAAPGPSQSRRENNRSLVMRVRFGQRSFLLAGDVVGGGERRILAARQKVRADVLKLGHHGVGGTSEAWLRSVAPRYAVASCGYYRRGLSSQPRPALLARLKKRGVRLLRTDRQGDIVFETDGRRLLVRTEPAHRFDGP
jgi:beta-lactamase superfamily II metal-dependent hydrolase